MPGVSADDRITAQEGRAGGRWRFGIRAKLVVAVGTVAGMIMVASLLTWFSYSEIERLLAAVTRTNLPSLSNALKLSEATARLAAAAPALDGSQSQFQRQSNFVALQQQTERLLALVDHLAGSIADTGRVEELRSMIAAFADNVVDRNILVDKRLQLAERSRVQAEIISQLDVEVHRAMGGLAGDPALATVVLASNYLREAVVAANMEKVGDLRGAYEEQVRSLAELVDASGAKSQRTRELTRRVLALGTGPENVFELRTLQMLTIARLAAANDEGRDLVARTSSSVGRLVSAAEAEAAENERRTEAAVSSGRTTMLVVAMLTFFGPLLFIWLYLGRSVVARLAGLASSMHAIAEGDFQAPIPGEGNDEISDMAAELAVFRDAMAKLQESSEALIESERRLRRILDTSPLALAISRVSDNAILLVNPRWSELYRVPKARALGTSVASCYADPDNRARLVEMVRKRGFVGGFECRMRASDGHEFWAMLSAAEIEMDGEPAVIASSTDITRHKEEEAALAEAKKVAEEASQAKSLFLATMSHEIRTPMNGVLTMAHLLEDMPLPAEQREMARVIRDSATSLLTIINDILDFSKIEAGKLQLELVELSVSELVEGVADLLTIRAQEKGISLITFVEPALADRVVGDPIRLRQIITNLAGNAIKFTDKGYVRISARAMDPRERPLRLEFAITDTGIGLDAEQQARLFEPFMQADVTISRRYGGTGLGLSICRRLVAMMEGDIGVRSNIGQGSTFWFQVPLEPVEAEAEAGPDLSGIAVLVLAEGPVAAECLRQYLGHLGAQVAVVVGAEGAVAAVRAAALAGWTYDVALLDGGQDFRMRMGVAGALVTAAGPDLELKVAMLVSQDAFAAVSAEVKAAGLYAALPKPVRRRQLWRSVAAAVGRASAEADTAEGEGIEEGWKPPAMEEAAAAGALILVAEDNPTNKVVIRHLMERLGYAIEVVGNGAEAWERMQIRDYGLLLTDCHMPEMDGYELTQRIREWEMETGHLLPIVALTADALAGTARRCLDCGMNAFLAKPIDLAQLDATIRRLLPAAVGLRRRRSETARPAAGVPVAVAPPEDPALPPVLDLAPMRQIFGDIGDEVRELLALFVDTTRPLVADLGDALVAGDAVAGREAAHSAKGAGNSAGAFRFARLCAEAEAACAASDLARAASLQPALEAAFDEAAEAVAAV
ncbi:Signal transduction histidine kinase [Paramagnetospirillum caucaseum]|uniref:Sensory/regulatory protein RpfC n=1 Tax=Paramagnetospirillum caucaseum TaxID=1244869 RepID=M2YE90_9PROT|nr:ATP-binding protein [Paramagnetospirillum caucaseum]EME71301.1 Signal transduction histidine kinase [Paramagnetospirillum caucaseum]